MATRPAPEETRVKSDTRDEAIVHDFVYRPEMGVKEIAEHLGMDWDNAYDWIKEKLEQADEDE